MKRRIKEKHEKQCSTGEHGLHREFKKMLKKLGIWSRCQSQQEILRNDKRRN